MSEEEAFEIKQMTKGWLTQDNYGDFDQLGSAVSLYHYELRAALYDFYIKGDDDYKEKVKKSQCYKSIISGEVHKYNNEEIKTVVFELRQISAGKGNSVRGKEVSLQSSDLYQLPGDLKFRAIAPVSWSEISGLYKSESSPFPYESTKDRFVDDFEYMECVGGYPDLDIKNGLLTVSIRLESDEDRVIRELKKLLMVWRHQQQGVLQKGGSQDLKRIQDSRLLMLCDLLLWCKLNNHNAPQYPLIFDLIYGESCSESQVKQTHLKRARRLLDWPHLYYLHSQAFTE